MVRQAALAVSEGNLPFSDFSGLRTFFVPSLVSLITRRPVEGGKLPDQAEGMFVPSRMVTFFVAEKEDVFL